MTLGSRSILDREIRRMREMLLQMGSLVETAVDQAMTALNTRDLRLAQDIIHNDDELNRLRFDLEELAQLTLATQQPAARDLRQIIAAIHLATELERMGDHASGIARLVLRLEGDEPIDSLHKLPKMAKRARKMVQEGIQAFINEDMDLAHSLVKRDNKLDRHYNQLFRETLEEMQDATYVRRATFLLWIGHNLERIGDRATNMAERVIFMVTGEFIENIDEADEYILD
ncbi:MAG: phosphate signaling complex protein PhoU [Anaerolineales bacterium]|nr:phosphate signaling complex protein PhoU [Anaerolineales bacterium]